MRRLDRAIKSAFDRDFRIEKLGLWDYIFGTLLERVLIATNFISHSFES